MIPKTGRRDSGSWLPLLGAALALAIGCVPWAAEPGALPGQQQAQSSSVPEGAVTSGSGIYGYTVAEWGNPPANPPTTQCLKVFDSSAITPCHRRLLWHMGELSRAACARTLCGRDWRELAIEERCGDLRARTQNRRSGLRSNLSEQYPCLLREQFGSAQAPNLSAARPLALAASRSRSLGGAVVASERISRVAASVISSTAA